MNMKNVTTGVGVLAVLAGSMVSVGAIRDTRTEANVPSVARMGDPANARFTITVTADYTVDFIRFGGTWGASRDFSWIREAMVRVIPPASTGAAPFVVNASAAGVTTAGTYNGFGFCPTPIPTVVGDVWEFEFFDNVDDATSVPTGTGAGFGAYDSIWTSVTVSLDDGPRAAFPGPIGSDFVSFTGVNSDGLFGSASNSVLTWNVTTPLTAQSPALRTVARGTALTGQSADNTIAAQMSISNIHVTPPPGSGVAPFVAFANTAFPSSVTVIGNTALAGLQNGGVGEWTFRFFQSADLTSTGTLGDEAGVDAIWTNVRFELLDAAPVNTPLGDDPSGQFATTVGGGQIQWYRFNLTQPISRARNNAFSIDNEGSTTTPVNDTFMAMYQGFDGFARAADVADGSNDIAMLSFGADTRAANPGPTAGVAYNGRDGGLAAGEWYLAVGAGGTAAAPPTFGGLFSIINVPAAASGPNLLTNIALINNSLTLPTPTVPAGAVDIGTVGTGTPGTEAIITRTWTAPTDASAFQWYRFVTTADATDQTGFYLDIDTEGTAPTITGAVLPADTEMGLYAANGLILLSDDDDGSGSRSAISLGDRLPNRPAVTTLPSAAGVARNGRDGILPAGEYYLAVSFFNTLYPAGTSTTQFELPLPAAAAIAAPEDVIVNFRTNLPGGGPTCNSRANFAGPNQDTTPDAALTADDIIVFLGYYFGNATGAPIAGNPASPANLRADVSGANQNASAPDGTLTADDIIVFLGFYFQGCP
ncbi:MAG: hypothetical protein MUE97_02810 [Phycisphaerales bacterium]|nr:hypothetical protein [Phycisphaerales bacterium]